MSNESAHAPSLFGRLKDAANKAATQATTVIQNQAERYSSNQHAMHEPGYNGPDASSASSTKPTFESLRQDLRVA